MTRANRGEGSPPHFYQRVYTLVRCVPSGRVVTYGQVAALLGVPHGARAVGYALRALSEGSDVPWHRVLNAQGYISPRHPAASPILQRVLLEAEGVAFNAGDGVSLPLYRWQPDLCEV